MLRALLEKLSQQVKGKLLLPEMPGFKEAMSGFNTAIEHNPAAIVCANSVEDIQETVRFASANKCPVYTQLTGHGAINPLESGILIVTKNLNTFSIDPATSTATISAGVVWKDVIAEASKHKLAPIAGSSETVGAIGYMLGGGFGPLVRSHGLSSNYVTNFKVITATGELINANQHEHSDLFWALKGGGNLGFGVITEMQIHLERLEHIYGGLLTFSEEHIEPVFRKWVDWSQQPNHNMTTSIAIFNFPDRPHLPVHYRGKRLLMLRVAYPGSREEAEELIRPITDIAKPYLGKLDILPASDIRMIHQDPETPGPAWIGGRLIDRTDSHFADIVLQEFGQGAGSILAGVEIRQLGGVLHTHPAANTAVAGHLAHYCFGLIGKNPMFYSQMPEQEAKLLDSLKDYIHPERNFNFSGKQTSAQHFADIWSGETYEKLQSIRRIYDPQEIFCRRIVEQPVSRVISQTISPYSFFAGNTIVAKMKADDFLKDANPNLKQPRLGE